MTSRRLSLLVVEDERPLARLWASELERLVDATLAHSLDEARQRLRGRSFDVILLDLNLPDGSGLELLAEVAPSNASVLISGETGTGKEVAARLIHHQSARREAAFVPINCAALPRELAESELFGHRKGAFTGADRDHRGLILAATGGTLL